MTVRALGLAFQRETASRRRVTRGYSRNRVEYDARRRGTSRTDTDRAYWDIVKADPCSYCGAPAAETRTGVNDVDHIVNLDAGGEDHWTNYTSGCPACNRGVKKDRDLLTTLLALSEE